MEACVEPIVSTPVHFGVTLKDVAADSFIKFYAAHLKKQGKLEIPKWTEYVKTGTLKELAPYEADWYYIRAAAMARQIYIRGKVGVGAFTRIYGGNKHSGVCPAHFCRGSGKIARSILQGLEKLNILERSGDMRKMSINGQRDLDRIAGQCVQRS
nr:40S ribosomal protein S19 [Paratrimastix eleionoma]